VDDQKVDELYCKLHDFNSKHGYFLNSDIDFSKDLVHSLLVNEKRYGYEACPCRLASGVRAEDIDIICPCNYRDQDITDFGSCYCGLYVSKDIFEGRQELKPIPERRKSKIERNKMSKNNSKPEIQNSKLASKLPIWRCTVCGYFCARESAPDICPICGVAHDRFEKFDI
jgi:ferredoxin-thioredoxin reductase catalytic chain